MVEGVLRPSKGSGSSYFDLGSSWMVSKVVVPYSSAVVVVAAAQMV